MTKKRRRTLLLALGAAAALAAALAYFVLAKRTEDPVQRLDFIKSQIESRFPDAPRISSEELAKRMESGQASGEELVLLDVRRPDEYEVSHLPGAIRVDPDASPSLPEGVPDDAQVVAYCAVGWRSARWVEELRSQGVDASNLEGSIFQWVAEGRPLVRDGERVDVVHPYSRAWAWLVDPEHRAMEPGERDDS